MRFTFSHSLHHFLDPSCRKTGWLNHFFFILDFFLASSSKGIIIIQQQIFYYYYFHLSLKWILLKDYPGKWFITESWQFSFFFIFLTSILTMIENASMSDVHFWLSSLIWHVFFIHNPPPSYYAAIGKAVLASFSFGKSSFLQLPLFFILNEIHFNHDEPSSISHCAWQTCSTYLILFFKKSTSL